MGRNDHSIKAGDTVVYESRSRSGTSTFTSTGTVTQVNTNVMGHDVAHIETADGGVTGRYAVTVRKQ